MKSISSAVGGTSTSGDTAVDLLTNADGVLCRYLRILIGTVAGFFSMDGGTTWHKMNANEVLNIDLRHQPCALTVKVKRIASGTDLSGAFASAW